MDTSHTSRNDVTLQTSKGLHQNGYNDLKLELEMTHGASGMLVVGQGLGWCGSIPGAGMGLTKI